MKLDTAKAQTLIYAMQTVVESLTDNSCGDPECCGGPYWDEHQVEEAAAVLAEHDITIGLPEAT